MSLEHICAATLALLLIPCALATTGIDISQPCNSFACMKGIGVDFSISRAWKSYGAFDSGAVTSLNNAWAAGIPYNDVYMFPCRGQSATTQVNSMLADLANAFAGNALQFTRPLPEGDVEARGFSAGRYRSMQERTTEERGGKNIRINDTMLREMDHQSIIRPRGAAPAWRRSLPMPMPTDPAVRYGMIWFDIEINPSSGCGWGTNYASNCNYLQELASAAAAKGANFGFYSSEYEWETTMGSRSACGAVNKYPLWYAHYDNSASFSDFSSVSFGTWSAPAIKQYEGDVSWCSFDVDANWY